MRNPDQFCRSCFHVQPHRGTNADGEPVEWGTCRRFPPQIYNQGKSSAQPPVDLDKGYCGEHAAKPKGRKA